MRMGQKRSRYETKMLRNAGKELLRIRKESGFSQAEFARRLGISVRTYARYERGEREAGMLCLYKIRQLSGQNLIEKLQRQTWERKTISPKRMVEPAHERNIQRNERFCTLTYSPGMHRVKTALDHLYIGAVSSTITRLIVHEFDLPTSMSPGGIDWLLLISYSATLLLMTFQITHFVRLFLWSRKSANNW